jgi:integrase
MIAINQRIREQRRLSRRFVLSKVGECLYRSECGSYFAVVKHLGKQHRLSLQTKDRDVARKKLVEFRQQLCAPTPTDRPAAKAANITFDELAKRWLDSVAVHLKPSTHFRRCGVVKVGLGRFREKTANKISKLACEQWATSRSKQVKGRTFNCELETLSLIFKYGISHELLSDNPAAGIRHRRLDTPVMLIPTKEQFKLLIAEMRRPNDPCNAGRQADTIELAAYSGCRVGEIRAMRWADVDFEKQTVTITGGQGGTKNGKVRVIPLFLPLRRLLLDFQSRLKHPPKLRDRIVVITDTRSGLHTACRRLGLPPYHIHTFRHFFASNAIEAGVDFKVIASWLGHSDGGVLVMRIYGHLRDEHGEAMAKRIVFDAGAGG